MPARHRREPSSTTSTSSVIGHGDDADPDRVGAGVLARVRERLADDEVRGELDVVRQFARRRCRASTGISGPTVSDSSASRSPRSDSATGCSPRARSRSSICAAPSSSLGEPQHVDRLIAAVELALSHLEQVRRPPRAAAARRRAGRVRRAGARNRRPRSRARASAAMRPPDGGARARPRPATRRSASQRRRRPRPPSAPRPSRAMWPRCVPSAARRQTAR